MGVYRCPVASCASLLVEARLQIVFMGPRNLDLLTSKVMYNLVIFSNLEWIFTLYIISLCSLLISLLKHYVVPPRLRFIQLILLSTTPNHILEIHGKTYSDPTMFK